MKRILILFAIILLPVCVWAMTHVADSDLSNVTGQAGVNINANLSMDIAIGTMAWGDSDGIKSVYNPWEITGTSTTGGYVGINGFNMTNLVIKARTEVDDNYGGYNTLMLKPITIDVATANGNLVVNTLSALPAARGYVKTEDLASGTTFVRFGLGALKISLDGMQFDVSLGKRVTTTETAGNKMVTLDQNMGTVSLGNMAMYINPWSYVDIYSASNSATSGNLKGVNFAVNVTIDKFKMDYMSWGDKDGFAVGNAGIPNGSAGTQYWMNNGTQQTAGYVGLDSLYVGPIAINGTVQIDVTTSAAGVYNSVPAYVASLGTGVPMVHDPISIASEKALLLGILSNAINYDMTYSTILLNNLNNYITANSTTLFQGYTNYIAWGHPGNYSLLQYEELQFLQYVNDNSVTSIKNILTAVAAGYYTAATTTVAPVSVVHISFPTDFIIELAGPITAAVKIGNTATFQTVGTTVTDAKVLGDIYLSGMKIDIYKGSWVDIWAH